MTGRYQALAFLDPSSAVWLVSGCPVASVAVKTVDGVVGRLATEILDNLGMVT